MLPSNGSNKFTGAICPYEENGDCKNDIGSRGYVVTDDLRAQVQTNLISSI
jgi:hypothetical protein